MQSQHLVLLVQYRPQVHIYLEIYYLLFWHIQRTSELQLSRITSYNVCYTKLLRVKKNQPVTEQNENKTDTTVTEEPAQEDTVKEEPKSEEPAKDAPATGETPVV